MPSHILRGLFPCLLALLACTRVTGHGALSFPRPRNALDGSVPPWSNWSYPGDRIHFCYDSKNCAGACPISAHSGTKGELNASNGMACYWFSNGCTVGCAECDGTQNHVGHGAQRFLYRGMNSSTLRRKNITVDAFTPLPGEMVLDRRTLDRVTVAPNCKEPSSRPTMCDPRLRTMNTQAECGSKEDIYYWSPWRSPGAAPIIDACGIAGGRHPGQGGGAAGAIFQNSSAAFQGERGSALPAMPAQAVWQAGAQVEVGWTVMANHGGGYAYRIAPADGPLEEATFRRTPLDFVGLAHLRWDGDARTQVSFDSRARGWETRDGTVPAGSAWRKNPIPAISWEREGPSFAPVCEESDACRAAISSGVWTAGVCRCSGYSNAGPLLPNVEMVDTLQLPAHLAPGRYVLQWRWDCEESDQVWSSCSDVTITDAA